MKTKKIEWSYPTSISAKRFGFYNTGCYTVQLSGENIPETIAGFATIEEAQKFADELPNAWSKLTRNIETEKHLFSGPEFEK